MLGLCWSVSAFECRSVFCKMLRKENRSFRFVFFSAFSVRVAGCCCFLSLWGVAGLTGAKSSFYSWAKGTPLMSRQLIAGPLLMAVAVTQGANCTSGAILGFSILLKDTSTCSSVPPQGSWGFEPATFWILVHQLYPMSYSQPSTSSYAYY